MDSDSSVSDWIAEVKQGNGNAAELIWNRFFPQLVQVARKRLTHVPRRMEDEEDVVVSALNSFFDAAQAGRFPDLADAESLWRILSRLTQRKAVDLIRRGLRTQTEDADINDESLADRAAALQGGAPVELANQLTPEIAAMLEEESRLLLESLAAPELRQLALAKLQGYTNEETAQRLDCSLRTVERRLYLIRKKWSAREPQ